MKKFTNVRNLALHDIADDMKFEVTKLDNLKEIYTFCASRLNSKETRYLNKLLGINRLNYIGNKNGIYNAKSIKLYKHKTYFNY